MASDIGLIKGVGSDPIIMQGNGNGKNIGTGENRITFKAFSLRAAKPFLFILHPHNYQLKPAIL